MTVPITPGPFSFLANIGRGVANYEQGLAQNRGEAMKQVGLVFDAVQNNQLSVSALKSPFFLNLLKRSGIADQFSPENVAPKPTETLARGQDQALGQVLPQILNPSNQGTEDQFARESLASGVIATTPAKAKAREETAKSTTVAKTVEAGGAAGRAAAGVQAEPVATAAEAAATTPLYNNVAGRSVDASLTTLKIDRIDPSNIQTISDASWGLAQSDAASKGYTLNEELTRPYIDAAIQQRLRQQEELDVKRLAAQNAGGGQDQYTKLIDFYQRQQQRVNDAIKTLRVPTQVERAYASSITRLAAEGHKTVDQVLADPATPALAKQAYTVVQAYETQLPQLQQEAAGYRDNLNQLLSHTIPVAPATEAPPAPSPGRDTTAPPGSATSPYPGAQGGDATAARRAKLQKASALLTKLRADEAKKPADKRRPDSELIAQARKDAGL